VAARVRKLLDTRRRAAIVQMMDQHNRRDPVGPLVFGLSVVLASFTVVAGALLFFPPEGERLAGAGFRLAGSVLSTVAYAVVYPIYRGVLN
jgi:hypothetical protein